MAEDSGIEWTDHTFSPWRGCTKVSPGCDNCYAEGWARRFDPGIWGPGATRAVAAQSSWDEVMRWNQRAQARGERRFVFPHMCDPFDTEVDAALRHRFWTLIRRTPALTWLLLTKRPNAMHHQLPRDWGEGWPNVWLGVSVENQAMADLRIPILIAAPAVKRFVSYEPALGPVEFKPCWLERNVLCGGCPSADDGTEISCNVTDRLDWIIAGGESTAGARAPDPYWFRNVRDDCVFAGVPFFFKQWGVWRPAEDPPDIRLQEAFSEIGIEHYRKVGETWMERGTKSENGHILDGETWQQFPDNPAPQSRPPATG